MNNEFGDFKRLLQTMVSGDVVTEKMRQKEEDRLWGDSLSFPLPLKDALRNLTKSDLLIIKNRLGISAGSQLKKQQIADILERRIPEEMDRVLALMDHDRYRILHKIVSKGGHIAAPQLEPWQLDYLRHLGLIFTGTVNGNKTLVMPQEVLDKLRDALETIAIRAVIQRNSDWIRLTHGLLFYHGTLYLEQLEELIARYTGEAKLSEDYLEILINSFAFYDEVRVNFDPLVFSYHRVPDPMAVIEEHRMRPAVSFFPFSKEQLLKAGEPGFVDRNEQHILLANFLHRHFTIARQEADAYAGECGFAARSGASLGSVITFLQDQFGEFETMEAVQALADQMVVFMNNTKQWALKGYAPNELSAQRQKHPAPTQTAGKGTVIDMATRKKVGRNDPCPCGSGKKAKKCCMAE